MSGRWARGVAAVAVLAALAAGCTTGTPPAGTVEAGWTALPDAPLAPRRSATAAWVADRFVVVGGWSDRACPPTADCVLDPGAALRDGAAYDPAADAWAPIAPAPVALWTATAAVVGDTLYVLGAEADPAGDTVGEPVLLAYDAGADAWATLPSPPEPWSALVAAGDVLLAIAGTDEHGPTTDAALDPATGRWRTLPDDPLGPSFDREAVWLDDRLLLAAKDLVPSPGATEPAVVRLAWLDADLATWSAPTDTEVIGWAPVAVGGHVVFPGLGDADGGEVGSWGRPYPFGGVLDVATGEWRPLPDVGDETTRAPLAGVVVGDRVVVGDGLLDPATGDWARLPGVPGPEATERAVTAGGGALLVWGGAASSGNLADGYLLRP